MFKRRFLIFGLCAFFPVIALHEYEHRYLTSDSIQRHVTTEGIIIPAADRSLRPNYPYSVVPGGAYSPAELEAAIQKEPLVREHYAGFDAHSAHLVKLTDDQYQFASFRLGNTIFWTHKRLRIPKGEGLITDGINYARTRCGNRLSNTPNGNTTPFQPADRLLSLPPFSPELLPQLALAETPETPTGVMVSNTSRVTPVLPAQVAPPLKPTPNWPAIQQPASIISVSAPPYMVTPVVPIGPGGSGNIPASPVPPPTLPAVSSVPEPTTISLFGIGLFISLVLLHRMSRKSRSRDNTSGQRES
jgi:hypothetical protein